MNKHILTLSFLCLLGVSSFGQSNFGDLGKTQYKNVYALVIGVSEYSSLPDKSQLNYAAKDARVVHHMLEELYPAQKANFDTLINENASQLAIVNGIRDLVVKAKEGDLVVFYFSGHGDVVKDIIDGEQGFFLAHDASNSRIYYPAGGAVEFSYVNKALTKITDNKAEVWMITDACKSGKVINTEGATNTMTSLNEGFKSTTKFISCGAHELSYEDEKLEQGVFTYYLVRAIAGEADTEDRPGLLNVDEINTYMKTNVRKYTESKQTPKVFASNEFVNIISTNAEFASLVKSLPEGGTMDDLASREGGKGEGDTKSPAIVSFEKLLESGMLHSKTDYAYEVLKSNSLKATPTDLQLMNLLLTEALLARGQRNTNIFLSGRPMIGSNEHFKTTAKDFELASELLGKTHPMYEQIVSRATFFTAMEQIQSGKQLDVAEATLIQLGTKYPEAAHINQGLAILYIEKSNKTKADEQLAKATEKVSTWSKPMNSSAYLSIIAGNLDAAKSKIKASEQIENDQDNVYLLNAYMHSANFELQNAEKAMFKIKNENGTITPSELLALEGSINELRGRITVATKMYQESLKTDGANVDLMMKLGNLYKNDGDTATALFYFKQVRTIDKDNQGAKANIALLTNAEVLIDNTLIDASDVNAVLLAVDVLEDKKEYGKAIDLLNRSISIIQWNPDLYYELGKMQYSNGDEKGSMTSVQKAIEMSPYHFKSIRSLAYMYLHQKKYNEADALIKKHDPYFKESAKYLALSYQVYRQMGSKNDLYPILERAIALDSLETDAYKALYRLHIENNMYAEAKREFTNLIEIGGGSADSIDFYYQVENQVKLMIGQGVYEGQKDGIKIILELDKYNFEMSYFLGLVLYMEKDYEGASDAIRHMNKEIQSYEMSVQRTYYNLKAKINLETGHPDLAERLFGMSGGNGNPPDYLGLAMAQFELDNPGWLDNFRRAGEPIDYNEDAFERYEKMKKKAAKMGGNYGGTERN